MLGYRPNRGAAQDGTRHGRQDRASVRPKGSMDLQEASASVRFLHGPLARGTLVSRPGLLNRWRTRPVPARPVLRRKRATYPSWLHGCAVNETPYQLCESEEQGCVGPSLL